MGRRLILDTNLLIAYERGTIDRSSLDDDELAIASVSAVRGNEGPSSSEADECRAETVPGHVMAEDYLKVHS